ncbi:MAG: sugar phosphate isomerase/epimerase, partial [Synergistaceae bacterium]|nr:sugar phosphate isomerase/epimerase [Synergistaceae bacterium]
MARKFSLAYLTIPGTNPMDQINIAKEAGYDFVSLRTIPMHLPGEPEFLPQKDPALFEAIRAALKEYDMPLMDIELARIRKDLDINEYKPAFEAAAKLGA